MDGLWTSANGEEPSTEEEAFGIDQCSTAIAVEAFHLPRDIICPDPFLCAERQGSG